MAVRPQSHYHYQSATSLTWTSKWL